MLLNFNGVAVSSRGRSGGLGMLWANDVDVILQIFSIRHIDVHVCNDKVIPWWRFTGFYGDLDEHEWYLSWDLLGHLSLLPSLPWMCTGDFNAILSASEKKVVLMLTSGILHLLGIVFAMPD